MTLELIQIGKVYKNNPILKQINISLSKGEFIVIKGKSGIGKSTLINIIAGLEKPSSGTYNLQGITMSEKNFNELAKIRGQYIGYISQYSPMISNLTAYENICIPLVKGCCALSELSRTINLIVRETSNRLRINLSC